MSDTKKQYLIYARKSTDDNDNQKNSIDYQIAQSMQMAKTYHLPIAPVTIDRFCTDGIIQEKHTAFKTTAITMKRDGTVEYKIERPKFQQLVAMLLRQELAGIICLCWDRISRNDQDAVVIKNLMDSGMDFRFVQANYSKSSSGALHRDIDSMFAQHYSRVISEKVKAANSKLRGEGKCLYPSPIGYLDNGSDNKEIDPERAPIVKQIFQRYASGEWSLSQLAKWANGCGLTTKPTRRRRTQTEILTGLDLADIPKVTRPISRTTVEHLLKNPFYIGKLKTSRRGAAYIKSNCHQAIIDVGLFNKVQEVLKVRNVSIQYVDKAFFTYRGLVRCGCGRLYTPYQKKGIIYYRVKCTDSCTNTVKNLKESLIDTEIEGVLKKIHFSDEELQEIEAGALSGLDKINQRRSRELDALNHERKKIYDDLTYLTKNKITLLRNQTMSMEEITSQEQKLHSELERIDTKLAAHQAGAREMLGFVITFSELVKMACSCYNLALDSEKREIAISVFSELVIEGGNLANYKAKQGFDALLKRWGVGSGSPRWLFSELLKIYVETQLSMIEFKKIPYLKLHLNAFSQLIPHHSKSKYFLAREENLPPLIK